MKGERSHRCTTPEVIRKKVSGNKMIQSIRTIPKHRKYDSRRSMQTEGKPIK